MGEQFHIVRVDPTYHVQLKEKHEFSLGKVEVFHAFPQRIYRKPMVESTLTVYQPLCECEISYILKYLASPATTLF